MRHPVAAGVLLLLAVCAAHAQDPGKPAAAPPAKESGADSSVAAALDWLARHQEADGAWRADAFSARCQGARCSGEADAYDSVGVTALSVLAFLGTGETHQSGSHRDTVKNALKWLRDVQDQEGFFGPKIGAAPRLRHAYAAMAMCEAYGMTGSKVFKPLAARAAACTIAMQDASGGWKLADGDAACDALLTGVCVLALRSAKLSELDLDAHVFDRAVAWLDASAKTSPPSADARTAAALAARIFARWDLDALTKDPLFAKDAELLAARPPEWTDKSAAPDLWTWCLAAPALFQKCGDPWTRWWAAFSASARAHRHAEKDVCVRGSWDPVDPQVPFGGRVATTAVMCRALETPYLYGRLAAKK